MTKHRLSLLLFLTFLFSRPAYPQFTTPLASASASAPTNQVDTVTLTLNSTGGNLIHVAVSEYQGAGAFCTLADSNGITWNLRDTRSVSGSIQLRLWDAQPTGGQVGAGHSFTCQATGQTNLSSMAVVVWANAAASASFQSATGNVACMACSTATTPSVTPANANSLVITAVAFDGPGSPIPDTSSISGSFTIREHMPCNACDAPATGTADGFGIGFAYLVQTAAASAGPTWTLNTAVDNVVTDIAVYKSNVVTPTGPKKGTLLTLGVGR